MKEAQSREEVYVQLDHLDRWCVGAYNAILNSQESISKEKLTQLLALVSLGGEITALRGVITLIEFSTARAKVAILVELVLNSLTNFSKLIEITEAEKRIKRFEEHQASILYLLETSAEPRKLLLSMYREASESIAILEYLKGSETLDSFNKVAQLREQSYSKLLARYDDWREKGVAG